MIQNYHFPKKAVLLLGNEKLGTPSEYIDVLDEAIEIP